MGALVIACAGPAAERRGRIVGLGPGELNVGFFSVSLPKGVHAWQPELSKIVVTDDASGKDLLSMVAGADPEGTPCAGKHIVLGDGLPARDYACGYRQTVQRTVTFDIPVGVTLPDPDPCRTHVLGAFAEYENLTRDEARIADAMIASLRLEPVAWSSSANADSSPRAPEGIDPLSADCRFCDFVDPVAACLGEATWRVRNVEVEGFRISYSGSGDKRCYLLTSEAGNRFVEGNEETVILGVWESERLRFVVVANPVHPASSLAEPAQYKLDRFAFDGSRPMTTQTQRKYDPPRRTDYSAGSATIVGLVEDVARLSSVSRADVALLAPHFPRRPPG
jgi:hypothetical protein